MRYMEVCLKTFRDFITVLINACKAVWECWTCATWRCMVFHQIQMTYSYTQEQCLF